MFERFTSEARRVLVRAQDEAEAHKSPFIRRHHILLGVLAEARQAGVTADVLAAAGIDREALRAALGASLAASESAVEGGSGTPPFTREARKALELALREALSLGHHEIADHHLLLGLLRQAEGPLEEVTKAAGLRYGQIRDLVRDRVPPGRRRGGGRRGPGGRRVARRWNPAVGRVMARAVERAGNEREITTGDVLVALLEEPGTYFAAVLGGVALPEPAAAAAEVDRLVVAAAADGAADAITVDDDTGAVTVHDEAIAAELKRLAGDGPVSPHVLRDILRRLQG